MLDQHSSVPLGLFTFFFLRPAELSIFDHFVPVSRIIEGKHLAAEPHPPAPRFELSSQFIDVLECCCAGAQARHGSSLVPCISLALRFLKILNLIGVALRKPIRI